jgi:hypothetical protein
MNVSIDPTWHDQTPRRVNDPIIGAGQNAAT